MALTQTAHQRITEHFEGQSKQLAVDATCGNGHDTLFLCQLGFNTVIGFDIQADAIAQTQARLNTNNCQATLHHAGHDCLSDFIQEQKLQQKNSKQTKIDCLMFNLGYLPGSDKSITTTVDSTLSALQQGCALLSNHGLISILCYPGHEEGALEQQAITQWLNTLLQQDWHIVEHQSPTVNMHSPALYQITRQF